MPDSLDHTRAAIDFIEAHLTEPLDLERIARAVHYSKYHLHRVFTGTVGMTIHDYVQRRRLTEAAKLLAFSGDSILDIALLSGYESQQAFTNAFTAMYKQPPSRYREEERFYPLQLRFAFREGQAVGQEGGGRDWSVTYATEEDVPCWMDLVRMAVDGFPRLNEEEYLPALREYIRGGRALVLRDGGTAAGVLLFSPEQGSIDFLATHPLYRRSGVPRTLLRRAMDGLAHGKPLSTTTYRAGDRADTGHRRALLELGFAEAELLVEYGYPTQRLILSREDSGDERTDDGQA